MTGLSKLEKGHWALQRAQPVVMLLPLPLSCFGPPACPKHPMDLQCAAGERMVWRDGDAVVQLGRTSVSRTCLARCGGREGSE